MTAWGSRAVSWCGAPPAPAELLGRWRLDPVLVTLLLAAFAIGLKRARRPRAFAAGWLVTALAFVSPLCPLSVSLFAGRALQHGVVTLVGAPLVAWGLGMEPRVGRPVAAAGAFAAVLWAWHAPALYDATFHSALVYWAMHASLFGAALWLWTELLGAPSGGGLLAVLLTCLQEGFLGALLTLTPRPLFAAHAATTWAWGLTPLQDQALGGAIMWIPGGLAFLAVALFQFARLLRPPAPAVDGRSAA